MPLFEGIVSSRQMFNHSRDPRYDAQYRQRTANERNVATAAIVMPG